VNKAKPKRKRGITATAGKAKLSALKSPGKVGNHFWCWQASVWADEAGVGPRHQDFTRMIKVGNVDVWRKGRGGTRAALADK